MPPKLGELQRRDQAAERVHRELGLDDHLAFQTRERDVGLGDDDRRQSAVASRGERVADEWAAAQLGERLGSAEALPASPRKHGHDPIRGAHGVSVPLH